MAPLSLTLREPPRQTIDMAPLTPDRLRGLDREQVAAAPVHCGNRRVNAGELFAIDGEDPSSLVIRGACERLASIGAGMSDGEITIEGAAGPHVGQGMRAGAIHVRGPCGAFAGAGMQGGRIRVAGAAGDFLGGALPGETLGMQGGTILVEGNAGERAGDRMRRGTIVIASDAGNYCGARMVAGTIVVLGDTGREPGAGMRRGTLLLSGAPASMAPTFNDAGLHDLGFLVLLLASLERLDRRFAMDPSRKRVHRYVGDLANRGQGEILVWA